LFLRKFYYNINSQYSSQYPSYPNQQNRNSSIPTIRIYGDLNSIDSNSKSGINLGNQSQNGFKAGMEVNIPLASAPETTSEINQREQTRTRTLKELTDQITKLCTPQNLILTQDQCKQLKDDVFKSISESMKNLKR
jgi:dihydroorotase